MADMQTPETEAAPKPKRRLFGPGTILALVVLGGFIYGMVQLANNMPGLEGRLAPNEPPQAIVTPDEAPAPAPAPAAVVETTDTAPEAVAATSPQQAPPEAVPDTAETVAPAPTEGARVTSRTAEALPEAQDPPAAELAAAPAPAGETTQAGAESAPATTPPAAQSGESAPAAPEQADTDAAATDAPETAAAPADPEPAPAAQAEAASTETEPAADPQVAAAPTDSADPDADPVAEQAAAATQGDAADAPPTAVIAEPTFDIIRIDATGAGIVAGRAEPGATVQILSGAADVLATVEASATGEFVAFIQTPSQDEGQVLSLNAALGGEAVGGAESVLVLPGDVTTGDEAPLIVRADADEVRVVQPSALGKVDGVTLDAITYDEAGAVKLSGRAAKAGPIRIYVDGAPVGAAEASEGGTWGAILDTVQEGRYVLRVDALNPDGSVASRAESPFQRVFPTAEQRANPTQITVQPGNTLWVMAVDRYGDGLLYTQIFQANSDAIRDPDLIYPGQIFSLPDEEDFTR